MTKKSEIVEEKPRLNINEIKKGDLMAVVYWVKVDTIDKRNEEMQVKELDGKSSGFRIHGKDLIETCFSADHFTKEEKITATKADEMLPTLRNLPITVVFNKDDGTERTLRGRVLKPGAMGHTYMEDLDKSINDRLRLVNNRGIKSITVLGTKYTVKGK